MKERNLPLSAPRSLALAIAPLAIAETLFWAAYYYSFPGLLPAWEADLGWSRSEIAGAFTAALILTGVLAPQAGRLIDRGLAKTTFVGAGIAGAALLIALSMVQELWQFWAIWLCLGVINAACLYEACFAIITVTVGAQAKKAITVTTLYAGFAGTISFPSAYALTEWMGWRGAVITAGALMLAVAIPLALLGFRWIEAHRAPAAETPQGTGGEGRAALRNPVFWYIAIAFSTIGIVHGMIISHIRPILDDRDVATALAVFIASMFGPMQVLGRVLMVTLGKGLSTIFQGILCFCGIAGGLALLYLARMEPWLALVFVVPYGASYGVVSIVRPVLTAEYLGRAGFGVISGMLGAPYMLGFAAGPTLAALIWGAAGYDVVIMFGFVLTLTGLGLTLLARQ
ncbi:MAG: MFS transporter [Pseudomonadota bacterium]